MSPDFWLHVVISAIFQAIAFTIGWWLRGRAVQHESPERPVARRVERDESICPTCHAKMEFDMVGWLCPNNHPTTTN